MVILFILADVSMVTYVLEDIHILKRLCQFFPLSCVLDGLHSA